MKDYIKSKILFLILFISLLLNSCTLLKNKFYEGLYSPLKPTKKFSTTLPFTVLNGKIFIEIQLEEEKYRFLFDTGSSNYISKDVRNKLKLYNPYDSTRSIDFEGEVKLVEQIRLDLKLNSLNIYNARFKVADIISQECDKIDGVFGSELLNQGYFHFDNKNKLLTISNSIEMINLKEYTRINFKKDLGVIKLKIKRRKYVLDTGFNGFIMNDIGRGAEKEYPFCYHQVVVVGLNGGVNKNIYYKADSLKIDNLKYSGIVNGLKDLNYNLIGGKWFLQNDVIINSNQKELFIKKHTTDSNNYSEAILKFNIDYLDSLSIINGIVKSDFELDNYDIILSINEFSFNNITSKCELRERLKQIDFTKPIKIEILRNNQRKIIIVEKSYFFFDKN